MTSLLPCRHDAENARISLPRQPDEGSIFHLTLSAGRRPATCSKEINEDLFSLKNKNIE